MAARHLAQAVRMGGARTVTGKGFNYLFLPTYPRQLKTNHASVSDLRSEPCGLKPHHLIHLFFGSNPIYKGIL